MGSLFLELSKQESLLKMMEEKGYTLIQQNGQRTYGGPPPNWGARPPPSRDCEVFIGRLPRWVFEDELIPLFSTAGELYEFRLMLDFSGTNRGYGYAHYATPQGAANAIKLLNKYEIKDGHQIGVLKSKNNCRLLFGNLPYKFGNIIFNKEGFEKFIRATTENVMEVVMFSSYNELKKTAFNMSMEVEETYLAKIPKGHNNTNPFAIVEYENHKSAAIARRVLIHYGSQFAIDWAVPPKERKRNATYENGDALLYNNNARAIQGMKNETRMLHSQPGTKPRPVPPLIIGESIFDRIAFIPLSFQNVLNYFKFLIKEAIFSCANRLEIPRQVAEEIEVKIIKRITNLENCGQAVQLIFNYFAWLNEKKPNEMNPLTQKILQEVKLYSDSFVNHIVKKLSNEVVAPELDEYYMTVLPTELNLIYRYALTAVGVDREKFCGQISKSLEWLRRFAKLYTAAKIGAPNNVIVNQNQAKEPVPQFNKCLKPLNVLQNSNVGKSLQYNDNDRIVNQNDTSAFSWNNFHSELRKIEDQKENIPNWDSNWNQSRPQMINNNHSKGFAPQGREIPMNYGFYGQNALDQINGNNSGSEFCTNENSFKPVEYTQFNNWDLRGTFNGFSRNNSQVVNSGSPQMCFSPDSGISTDLEQNFFPISRNGMEQATLMREK